MVLREHILSSKSQVFLKTLQRFQGKCVSFSFAVPAAKLFIREISRAITSANDKGLVSLNEFQREEVLHWRFLDDWRQSFPWREEKHYTVSLSTDASGYGWGCGVHGSSRDQISGGYWNYEQRELFVSSKKMLALVHARKTLPEEIWNCKMDALADSRVVIGAWEGQGGKTSPQLMRVTKELFFCSVVSQYAT